MSVARAESDDLVKELVSDVLKILDIVEELQTEVALVREQLAHHHHYIAELRLGVRAVVKMFNDVPPEGEEKH